MLPGDLDLDNKAIRVNTIIVSDSSTPCLAYQAATRKPYSKFDKGICAA